MQEILSLALSAFNSLGMLPFVQAMMVIAVVGGFITVVFRNR